MSPSLTIRQLGPNDEAAFLNWYDLWKKGFPLLNHGGHIGYAVAPSHRGKGYASALFQAALSYCRDCGIDRVLVTCNDDNQAS